MDEDMVLRSVNLRVRDDNALRQFAFDRRLTKSDLIRAAIHAKLEEWQEDKSGEVLQADLMAAQRG